MKNNGRLSCHYFFPNILEEKRRTYFFEMCYFIFQIKNFEYLSKIDTKLNILINLCVLHNIFFSYMISLSLLKLCSLSKEKWIPFDFVNKLSRRSLSTPHKKVILWGPRCTRDDIKLEMTLHSG